MKSAGRLFTGGLVLILAGGWLAAQETAAAPAAVGPSKIMFINISQILQGGTEESKVEFGRVQAFVDEQNKINETRTQELQNRQQQLSEQARALNPQTLAEMQRELAKKEKELTRYREDTAEEIEARRNEAFAKLGQKLQTVLNEVATEKGYTAILYMDSMAQNGLAGYINPANDITQQVIDRYNAKYPVDSAAASSGQ